MSIRRLSGTRNSRGSTSRTEGNEDAAYEPRVPPVAGSASIVRTAQVRDIIDDLFIQVNGSFVAGYKVSGINSYYASDGERNRTKLALEALVRSLPERSMRMQARFEISEGTADLIGRHNREQ